MDIHQLRVMHMLGKAIANYINDKFGTNVTANNIYMTCGAAASLTIVMNAILQKDDECIVFTPYFPGIRGVY